ncbi:MAG: type II toxin-antitoxin system Phd/YefM family antitoxin [Acidobacteria bacterium]|nr:type II toxin-antitoxin system Phd/YefM family antitoxin [Acidobacteriota bacterium]
MPTIGVRELKQRTTQIARSVREDGARYIVALHGEPFAALVPLPDDWEERVLATVYAGDLVQAESDYRAGRTVTLEKALARKRAGGRRPAPAATPKRAAAATAKPSSRSRVANGARVR